MDRTLTLDQKVWGSIPTAGLCGSIGQTSHSMPPSSNGYLVDENCVRLAQVACALVDVCTVLS